MSEVWKPVCRQQRDQTCKRKDIDQVSVPELSMYV